MNRTTMSALFASALLLTACGAADEPDDSTGDESAEQSKADDARRLEQVDLVAKGSLDLGDGTPQSVGAIGEQFVVADDDCADGCLHLVAKTADGLELLDSITPSSGTRAIEAAPIPGKGAVALATDSAVSIVDVADGTLTERQSLALASEPADIFAGAAILLVARGEGGLDVVRLRMDEPEPATTIVEGVTGEHTWIADGEEQLVFFRPIEIELGRDNQLITRTEDGTLFRTNIPAPDLIVHDAAVPETVLGDVLVDTELGAMFTASSTLGVTELNEFSLKAQRQSTVEGVDVQRLVLIPGSLGTYVGLGAETIGMVTIDTDQPGAEIVRTVEWRPLGELTGATDAVFLAADRSFLVTSPRGLDWLALP